MNFDGRAAADEIDPPKSADTDAIDAGQLRAVLGHFASGVVILAARDEDGPVGMTCQAFFSLSLDPPLVAVAPSRTSTSWPRIAATGVFCANVLAEEQEGLCRAFAVSGAPKFEGVGWRGAPSGSPILDDVLAYVDCCIEQVHDGGDHFLVVGRILEVGHHGGPIRPLLFYRGGFGRFEI